ncbi:hypothetical protein GCM10011591_13140 [Nocardia camponoti]|uniref:Uncharacterized protein n=1 Tax=Nocardia camponoti TaxID=1616106 RepID=A0A917QDD6_9NOCA|nr:hypothetical protein GCM10011591_13140 [Nocardia camponoti]
MAAEILRAGAAAPVAVEARERIGAALIKRPPKHVSIGHSPDPMGHTPEVPQDNKSLLFQPAALTRRDEPPTRPKRPPE